MSYTLKETNYEWIMNTDNRISGDPGNEGNNNQIDIGFNFPFFDGTYNQFWLSSEGFISFGEQTTYCYKISVIDELPSTHPANPGQPKICAFWDDLDTGG